MKTQDKNQIVADTDIFGGGIRVGIFCIKIGLNPNCLFRPICVTQTVVQYKSKFFLFLYSNWSECKIFCKNRNVMLMRHKVGLKILPTTLKHSDSLSLIGITYAA